MKFGQLKHRVIRAEALVDGRRRQTVEHADALIKHWKQGWTPWRIVAAGLGLGFLAGQTRPSRVVGATKWLRVINTVSGMFTSLQAAVATWQADQAAHSTGADAGRNADEEAVRSPRPTATSAAGTATDDSGHAAAQRVSSYGRSAEGRGETEHWAAHPPRPAEAATDVSER